MPDSEHSPLTNVESRRVGQIRAMLHGRENSPGWQRDLARRAERRSRVGREFQISDVGRGVDRPTGKSFASDHVPYLSQTAPERRQCPGDHDEM